jgi:hypothetical protein
MSDSHAEYHFPGFSLPTTTPVPDELFDELLSRLTGAELKALLYIVRRTFGFKKAADAISFNQFQRGIITRDGRQLDRGCGVKDRTTLSKSLTHLEEMGIVVSTKGQDERGENETTTYALRFDGSSAQPLPSARERTGKPDRGGRESLPPVVGEPYHRSRESRPEVVGKAYQHETVKQQTVKQHGTPTALETLWEATLTDLREQMVPTNFARWLARTSLLGHEAGAAVVGVPDQVSAEQLAKRFDPLVRRALADACGEAVAVRYEVVDG